MTPDTLGQVPRMILQSGHHLERQGLCFAITSVDQQARLLTAELLNPGQRAVIRTLSSLQIGPCPDQYRRIRPPRD